MEKICTACGSIGRSKTLTKGSFILELILWAMMILPGMCYTVWRLTTRGPVCSKCLSPNLVPLSSPMGRKLQADFLEMESAVKKVEDTIAEDKEALEDGMNKLGTKE